MSLQRLLIRSTDFVTDKLIPQNSDVPKIERAIREAQNFDLMPLLGSALFYDLTSHYDADDSGSGGTKYDSLMLGTTYTNSLNETVAFSGLGMALKYWAYARYIQSNQVNVTTHGIVFKKNDNSEPVDSKTLKREVDDARAGAVAYWKEVEAYLNEHRSSFTLWGIARSEPRSGFGISAAGGDSKRGNTRVRFDATGKPYIVE